MARCCFNDVTSLRCSLTQTYVNNVTRRGGDADHGSPDWSRLLLLLLLRRRRTDHLLLLRRLFVSASQLIQGKLKLPLSVHQTNSCSDQLRRDPLGYSRVVFRSDADKVVENGGKETRHGGTDTPPPTSGSGV